MRDSIILKDGAKIDVTTVFGGMNIIVPTEWRVVIKGVPIFGGCSNKTHRKMINIMLNNINIIFFPKSEICHRSANSRFRRNTNMKMLH